MKNFAKKIVLLVCVFIMVFMSIQGMALANEAITVTINGQKVVFNDQEPVIVDGRTLVPVRGVFETLGFNVEWDNSTRTAILTKDGYIVNISIGSNNFTTNGTSHTLDVPAQIINGSTMLPIRAVLESVGYALNWDSATNTVVITNDEYIKTEPTSSRSPSATDLPDGFHPARITSECPYTWTYVYEGYWKDGLPNGEGILTETFANTTYRKVYKGTFINGLAHGEITMETSGYTTTDADIIEVLRNSMVFSGADEVCTYIFNVNMGHPPIEVHLNSITSNSQQWFNSGFLIGVPPWVYE
jgi:hypothetical protein